jgi:hypothetical protein
MSPEILPVWSSELLPKCRQCSPERRSPERWLEWSESLYACIRYYRVVPWLGARAGELVARFERDEIAGYVWFGKGGREERKRETVARTACNLD